MVKLCVKVIKEEIATRKKCHPPRAYQRLATTRERTRRFDDDLALAWN